MHEVVFLSGHTTIECGWTGGVVEDSYCWTNAFAPIQMQLRIHTAKMCERLLIYTRSLF